MSYKKIAAFKAGYIMGLNKAIETPETDALDVIDLISGAENEELIRRLFLTSQGQNDIDTNH